jgi:hypothetical protein
MLSSKKIVRNARPAPSQSMSRYTVSDETQMSAAGQKSRLTAGTNRSFGMRRTYPPGPLR